jgi:hypothetical protein
MRTIQLTRGETLAIRATAKDEDGDAIDLQNGYLLASECVGNGGRFNLAPIANTQGKLEITKDTVNFPAGKYQLDIRITKDSDQFTDRLFLIILEPITPPAQR